MLLRQRHRRQLELRQHDVCCGACRLEQTSTGTTVSPRTGAPAGAVKLEGSERVAVLYRIADRRVDRIRVFSEDCELDAGGRAVHWLDNVRPADSVALLESFTAADAGDRSRIVDGAVSAIALHGDPSADASLERLIATSQPESLRKKVTFWLGNARGRRGFDDAAPRAARGSEPRGPQERRVRAVAEPRA